MEIRYRHHADEKTGEENGRWEQLTGQEMKS